MLVSIPGIGKKLAERIIFELKEKVAAAGVAARSARPVPVGRGEGEVVAALQALGYSLAEAREASRAALADPAPSARRSRSGSRPRCGPCSGTDGRRRTRRRRARGHAPALGSCGSRGGVDPRCVAGSLVDGCRLRDSSLGSTISPPWPACAPTALDRRHEIDARAVGSPGSRLVTDPGSLVS